MPVVLAYSNSFPCLIWYITKCAVINKDLHAQTNALVSACKISKCMTFNDSLGSFYVRYPRHRTLISINKRFTGTTNHEFNLRHDWNSLISNNRSLELRHYTDEYFPNADTYVRGTKCVTYITSTNASCELLPSAIILYYKFMLHCMYVNTLFLGAIPEWLCLC